MLRMGDGDCGVVLLFLLLPASTRKGWCQEGGISLLDLCRVAGAVFRMYIVMKSFEHHQPLLQLIVMLHFAPLISPRISSHDCSTH